MLHGDFQTVGLPDIIQLIVQNKRTGILTIVKADDEKSIYFHNGMIIGASSTSENTLLGQILIKKKILNEETLAKALEMQKSSNLKLGEILEAMGVLTKENLNNLLILQIEEIFVSLFQWLEAEFSFVDLEIDSNEMLTINLDANKLLMDTAIRIDEWNNIKKYFPDFKKNLKIIKSENKIKVTKNEYEILKKISEKKNIATICQEINLPEIDTLKLIYNLKNKGLVENE